MSHFQLFVKLTLVLLFGSVFVSASLEDTEVCCNGTVRFTEVRYLSSDSIIALVQNITACESNATTVGSGWLKVDLSSKTVVAAKDSDIKTATAAATARSSAPFSSLIELSEEDKSITLSVTNNGAVIWNNTIGCDVTAQLGPTWVSVELQKAYFILPDCDNPNKAQYAIVDLLQPEAQLEFHDFPVAELKFIGTRHDSLTSSNYFPQGFVFAAASGPCADQLVISFTNNSVSALDDNYIPARIISFIDPFENAHFVETQLDPSAVQLVSYRVGQTPVTYQLSTIEAVQVLTAKSSGSDWWLYIVIGCVAVGAIALIGAVAAYLVVRHRRREAAKEGQVEEYDPDLGYAEL